MSKRFFAIRRADYSLLTVAMLLTVVGIIMVHSASVNIGIEEFGDPNYYFRKQATSFLIGIFVLAISSGVSLEWIRRNAALWLIATLGVLVLVLIFPASGNVKSWAKIGPFVFQTSELAKLTFILFFAAWLEKRERVIHDWGTFISFLVIIGLVAALVMMQPDLGTLSIIMAIAFTMYVMAGMRMSQLLSFLGISAAGAWFYIMQAPYRLQRILTFVNPSADAEGAGYHLRNIAITVGTGSWWGLGLGQSRQKRLFLPEPHNDSIYAVIVEELGFIRAALILMGVLYLAWRMFSLAQRIHEPYPKMVLIGIGSWVFWQTFLNVGAMIGLVPLTGVPLPFISYGGSSLLVLMAAIGIALSASKYTGR